MLGVETLEIIDCQAAGGCRLYIMVAPSLTVGILDSCGALGGGVPNGRVS